MDKKAIPVVTIGAKEYFVLNKVGQKYFVLAKYCAGKGYYSLAPCQFRDSKLCAYLQQHFVADLQAAGVDTDKLYNISILTRGQFERFVKGKLPPLEASYILMNPVEDGSEQIYAVFPDESVQPVSIRSTQGIRIAMHIDKDYANELMGIVEEPEEQTEEPQTVSDTSEAVETPEAGEIIEIVVESDSNVPDTPAKPAEPEEQKTASDNETVTEPEDDVDDIVIEIIDTGESDEDQEKEPEEEPETEPDQAPETNAAAETDEEEDDIVIEIIDDDSDTAEEEETSEPEADVNATKAEEAPDNAEAEDQTDADEEDEDIVIEIIDDEPESDEMGEAEAEGEPEQETVGEEASDEDEVEIVVEAVETEEEVADTTEEKPEAADEAAEGGEETDEEPVEVVEETVEETAEEPDEDETPESEAVEEQETPESGEEEAEPDIEEQICKLRVITYLDGRRAHVFDNAIEINGYGYEGDEFCMDVPSGREYSIKARANSKTRILDVIKEGVISEDLTVELNYYTVHVSGDSGIGYTTGAGIYLEGTACSVNVSLVPGHEWDCWNGNPDNRSNPYDFVVTGRVYLKARSRINVRVQFRVDDEPYAGAAFICGMVHINGLDVPVSDNGIAETTVPSDTPVIVKVPEFSGDEASVQIYDDIPSMDLLLPVRYLTLYIRGDNGLAYINGAGIYREGSVVSVDIGCKDGYKLVKATKFYGNSFVSSGDGKGTIRLTQPTMYKAVTQKV